MESTSYKFGDYELDRYRYELRRNGRTVKLERIPMELLILLVENDGAVVSRQDIVQRLWGKDVFLDTEHGINTAARKIRAALKEDAENPRFVQTVTGKGYRFIANSPNGSDTLRPPATEREIPATNSALGQNAHRWLLATIAVVIVMAAVVLLVGNRLFHRAPSPQVRSIAVLPLANLSGDASQDYFADGMTIELITMMAKSTSLRVVSRTSVMQYKNARRPLKEIAQALHVDAVLEGSVERSANRLHMTVELIYAPTDTHLWANSYDRDGDQVSALPAEVALAVGKRLKAATGNAAPVHYISPQAHDAYLRGRYFWYAMDYKRAQEYMERAVQLQPDYAAAWSGVADSLGVQAIAGWVPSSAVRSKMEEASRRALQLDDLSAEAHGTAGAINLFFEWNWKVADDEIRRTLAIDSNSAVNHHLRAYFLTAMNRLDEALQEAQRAAQLEPFQHPFGVGLALLNEHQYDAAIIELRLRKEAQPSDPMVRSCLAKCYRSKGMNKEWATEEADLYELRGHKRGAAAIRQAFRTGGARSLAEWELKDLQTTSTKQYVGPLAFAHAYAVLQMKEKTLEALEDAYEERAPFLVFLQSDPDFDFLHADDRYRTIVRTMGLPPAY